MPSKTAKALARRAVRDGLRLSVARPLTCHTLCISNADIKVSSAGLKLAQVLLT